MTFSTAPRSRSPVLSICTQSEDAAVLRAEIQAASTQQQKFKRHKIRHWGEPTIEEESDLDELDHDGTCTRCHIPQPQRRSFSSSLHSITGTVRDELSLAKRFLKNTSLRKLHRIRSRPSSLISSLTDKQSQCGVVDEDSNCNGGSEPAELSCDPSYHQLEDNQRTSIQSDDFRPLMFMEEQKPISMENQTFDHKPSDGNDLSAKSLPCDNCQQPIRGGDHYDFCVLCSPSDRVLCMTCARQRKCRRHRSERYNLDDLTSARSSPAPPYTHPTVNAAPHIDYMHARLYSKHPNIQSQHPMDPSVHNNDISAQDSKGELDARVDRMEKMTMEAKKVLQALKKMTDQPPIHQMPQREQTLQEKEASLRDQTAALREERVAVKEQELLVREREHLSRERDAMVIRNLQTLVTIQELSRNGFIGSQFPSLKKGDDERPLYKPDPLARSKSHGSHDGISLEDPNQEHEPKPAITSVVAEAEATIKQFALHDKHIRSVPGQKRKKEGAASSSASASVSPSNPHNAGNGLSPGRPHERLPDQDDENDDEESTPPKKQKQDSSDPDLPQRIYACPYFKHDRVRYSPRNMSEKHYRGCAGHFLHDIPRLKQHLRRVHWRPEHHCERCFKVFSEPGQLSEHLGQVEVCSKKECPFPEKMDKAQRQQIHVKRPRVLAETLWYDIYKVLFPGSPLPESPYFEEEEITPPTSAAPSSASPEEATQRMIQIFNERLDKHEGNSDHGWLSSPEFRKFINSELTESMSELFNTLSLTPNTPQLLSRSQPPSIMVSPVTPPPNLVSKQSFDELHVSNPVSEQSSSGSTYQVQHKAPMLKQPKPRRLATYQKQDTNSTPNLANEQMTDDLPVLATTSSMNNHDSDEFANLDFSSIDYTTIDFPYTTHVDNGWDDQSGSYQQGDDQVAMQTMVLDCSTSSNHLKAPKPVRPRKAQGFVPVRLGALKEPSIDQPSGTQQLQASKSVASLVDSGYGSGNSERPGHRVPLDDEDMDIPDCVSPIGHTTFAELFQQFETDRPTENPWLFGDDLSYPQ